MSEPTLNVLAVVGSMRTASVTRAVMQHATRLLQRHRCEVDVLDLGRTPLAPYNPETSYREPWFADLKKRLDKADVFLLGTPDYHGSVSCTLKNFTDHFWREFAGKLFVGIVASHEKGLTVHDQLRTIARQCYAWSLPYGVSFQEKIDVQDGEVVSEGLRGRLEMMARDVTVYGRLLAIQRRADLAGNEPGFLARHRI